MITEERLKAIEEEIGSQPYSVVLGLIDEIRKLQKKNAELEEQIESRRQEDIELKTRDY